MQFTIYPGAVAEKRAGFLRYFRFLQQLNWTNKGCPYSKEKSLELMVLSNININIKLDQFDSPSVAPQNQYSMIVAGPQRKTV